MTTRPHTPDAPRAATMADVPAVLTHHWLVRRRGGEKVLEALADLLPHAPLHTLVYDRRGLGDSPLMARDVRPSILQRVPGATRHYPKLLPLMPWAFARMRLPPARLVVCSDAAIAKVIPPPPDSVFVCYCHSPPRYAWEPEFTRQISASVPRMLESFWLATAGRVRTVDRAAAQRVDVFVANSRHVQARIRRHYERESVVVHPPVALPPTPAPPRPREAFYLWVGQNVPYKRLDLALAACRRLKRRLVVIGADGAAATIRATRAADDVVDWRGWQPDDVIAEHYRTARALLFPGEEDFGIVPVEAMSHGCPVIAYGVGGATETVADGATGVLFDVQTADALIEAMQRCEQTEFDPVAMHAHCQQFSEQRFQREMRGVLDDALRSGRR